MHANWDMQVRHAFSLRANTRVHTYIRVNNWSHCANCGSSGSYGTQVMVIMPERTVWHTKQGDSVSVNVAGRVSCPLTVHHQHGRRIECAPLVKRPLHGTL